MVNSEFGNMAMISFNPESCINCGICIDICPLNLISDNNYNNSTPFMPDEMDNVCMKCGNCEAFCPENAISPQFSTQYSQLSETTSPETEFEQLGLYMRRRRSIRNYRNEPVDQKKIEDLLDIVRYAPSGMNKQPVNWLIIHSPEKMQKIISLTIDGLREIAESTVDHPLKPVFPSIISASESGDDPVCRGAPHLAIAYGEVDDPMIYTDCVVALSWFELAAPSFGMGSCWAGFVKVAASSYQPLIDELNLPPGHVLQHAMMFGYPEYEIHNIPGRNPPNINWS